MLIFVQDRRYCTYEKSLAPVSQWLQTIGIWLHCALRYCMRYDLHFLFYKILHIPPTPELLRPFCPRVFTLADHWNIFVKLRHQTYSAISFQKFSNNCILISGMPVSWKIKDFWFWPVFNKIFRFFATT